MILEGLSVKKKGRQTTPAERAKYRELWELSGLSKREFCEQEGLVLSTFLSWFSGLSKGRALKEREVGFLPISLLSKKPVPQDECKRLVVALPNGLSITGTFRRDELGDWLKELHHALIPRCS